VTWSAGFTVTTDEFHPPDPRIWFSWDVTRACPDDDFRAINNRDRSTSTETAIDRPDRFLRCDGGQRVAAEGKEEGGGARPLLASRRGHGNRPVEAARAPLGRAVFSGWQAGGRAQPARRADPIVGSTSG